MALGADHRQRCQVDQTLIVDVSRQGTTSTIALSGECDLVQQERLRTAIREVLAARPECVVLDLSNLSFIDSTGIQVVIELSRAVARDGLHLVVFPGARQVQRMFELCGLTSRVRFVGAESPDGRSPFAGAS
jgi:anti-sigma B factor antagonist